MVSHSGRADRGPGRPGDARHLPRTRARMRVVRILPQRRCPGVPRAVRGGGAPPVPRAVLTGSRAVMTGKFRAETDPPGPGRLPCRHGGNPGVRRILPQFSPNTPQSSSASSGWNSWTSSHTARCGVAARAHRRTHAGPARLRPRPAGHHRHDPRVSGAVSRRPQRTHPLAPPWTTGTRRETGPSPAPPAFPSPSPVTCSCGIVCSRGAFTFPHTKASTDRLPRRWPGGKLGEEKAGTGSLIARGAGDCTTRYLSQLPAALCHDRHRQL